MRLFKEAFYTAMLTSRFSIFYKLGEKRYDKLVERDNRDNAFHQLCSEADRLKAQSIIEGVRDQDLTSGDVARYCIILPLRQARGIDPGCGRAAASVAEDTVLKLIRLKLDWGLSGYASDLSSRASYAQEYLGKADHGLQAVIDDYPDRAESLRSRFASLCVEFARTAHATYGLAVSIEYLEAAKAASPSSEAFRDFVSELVARKLTSSGGSSLSDPSDPLELLLD